MIFGEDNRDAYTVAPEQGATGPLAGFMDAFVTSYEAQARTASQFGFDQAFNELEMQQWTALREAGVMDAPTLRGTGGEGVPTLDVASGYADLYTRIGELYSGSNYVPKSKRDQIAAFDERVTALREQFPDLGLRTSREMFEEVRKRAQEAERLDASQRRTVGGTIGGFLGGTIASMDPRTDPFNFATLGVGGIGKSVLMRIVTQTAGQGAVETVNQFTGVQQQREMLGLSYGTEDALRRIASTALGAGGLQLAGEGIAKAFRHFLKGPDAASVPKELLTPDKPELLALPPPGDARLEAQALRLRQDPAEITKFVAENGPLSGIRTGDVRMVADLDAITRQLDDWTGGDVANLKPRQTDVSEAVKSNTLYQTAKSIDPETFAKLEKLIPKRDTYRKWIDELSKDRNADVDVLITKMDARLDELSIKHKTTQGKTNKLRIREEIKRIKDDREKLLSASKETPDLAMVRKSLAQVDEKMRELAPNLGRAYAQARGKWSPDEADLKAALSSVKQGKTEYEPPLNNIPDYDQALQLYDRVPVLQRAQAARVEPKETSAETVSAVLQEERKILDEAIEAQRVAVKAALGETSDGKYRIGEHEFDLDKDKIWIANEDGTGGKQVTVRELLEQQREAEMELEAITTCSMPRSS